MLLQTSLNEWGPPHVVATLEEPHDGTDFQLKLRGWYGEDSIQLLNGGPVQGDIIAISDGGKSMLTFPSPHYVVLTSSNPLGDEFVIPVKSYYRSSRYLQHFAPADERSVSKVEVAFNSLWLLEQPMTQEWMRLYARAAVDHKAWGPAEIQIGAHAGNGYSATVHEVFDGLFPHTPFTRKVKFTLCYATPVSMTEAESAAIALRDLLCAWANDCFTPESVKLETDVGVADVRSALWYPRQESAKKRLALQNVPPSQICLAWIAMEHDKRWQEVAYLIRLRLEKQALPPGVRLYFLHSALECTAQICRGTSFTKPRVKKWMENEASITQGMMDIVADWRHNLVVHHQHLKDSDIDERRSQQDRSHAKLGESYSLACYIPVVIMLRQLGVSAVETGGYWSDYQRWYRNSTAS